MRVHILYISEDPSPLEANRSCIATKRDKKVTPACGFSFCLVTGPAAQVPRGRGVRQSVFRRRGNTVVHSRHPNAMLLSSELCTSTVRGAVSVTEGQCTELQCYTTMVQIVRQCVRHRCGIGGSKRPSGRRYWTPPCLTAVSVQGSSEHLHSAFHELTTHREQLSNTVPNLVK